METTSGPRWKDQVPVGAILTTRSFSRRRTSQGPVQYLVSFRDSPNLVRGVNSHTRSPTW